MGIPLGYTPHKRKSKSGRKDEESGLGHAEFQVSVWGCLMGEQSRLQIKTWESSTHRWELKPWQWMIIKVTDGVNKGTRTDSTNVHAFCPWYPGNCQTLVLKWITCYLNFSQSSACPTPALIYTQDFGFYSDLGFQCSLSAYLFPFGLTSFYTLAYISKCPVLELILWLHFQAYTSTLLSNPKVWPGTINKASWVWPGTQAQFSCTKS